MDDIKILKAAKSAYSPYRKEAIYSLSRDICIIVLLSVLLYVLAYPETDITPLIIAISVIGIVTNILLNCRLAILTLFEEKKHVWQTEKIIIEKITTEMSWSGHQWKSVISKLYPKKQDVGRYKIICRDTNGERIVLRSIMSEKKRRILANCLLSSSGVECTITYGKHSQIVFQYLNTEQWANKLNRML